MFIALKAFQAMTFPTTGKKLCGVIFHQFIFHCSNAIKGAFSFSHSLSKGSNASKSIIKK
jgi:hypothetical protein